MTRDEEVPEYDETLDDLMEHPAIEAARLEDQLAIHHAFGDDAVIWYREGGRCFDCGRDAWPPIKGQMGTDRHLRCYGCAAAFTMRELRTLDAQRTAA